LSQYKPLVSLVRHRSSPFYRETHMPNEPVEPGDLDEPDKTNVDPKSYGNDLKSDFHVANPIRSGLAAILPSKSRFFYGYSEPEPSLHGSRQ